MGSVGIVVRRRREQIERPEDERFVRADAFDLERQVYWSFVDAVDLACVDRLVDDDQRILASDPSNRLGVVVMAVTDENQIPISRFATIQYAVLLGTGVHINDSAGLALESDRRETEPVEGHRVESDSHWCLVSRAG